MFSWFFILDFIDLAVPIAKSGHENCGRTTAAMLFGVSGMYRLSRLEVTSRSFSSSLWMETELSESGEFGMAVDCSRLIGMRIDNAARGERVVIFVVEDREEVMMKCLIRGIVLIWGSVWLAG
jgi:hypothetical protein